MEIIKVGDGPTVTSLRDVVLSANRHSDTKSYLLDCQTLGNKVLLEAN